MQGGQSRCPSLMMHGSCHVKSMTGGWYPSRAACSADLEVGHVLVHLGLLLGGSLLGPVHGQAHLRLNAPPDTVLLIVLPRHHGLLQPALATPLSGLHPGQGWLEQQDARG